MIPGLHSYHWLHIPTGTRGSRETETPCTRGEFLSLLNRWNRALPGIWQYWS